MRLRCLHVVLRLLLASVSFCGLSQLRMESLFLEAFRNALMTAVEFRAARTDVRDSPMLLARKSVKDAGNLVAIQPVPIRQYIASLREASVIRSNLYQRLE